MSRVELLPEQVANQIAAGEVVERPASVVKELVENALDAGAGRIEVDIQAGGRSLIRVADDGAGMDRDDALTALERHATSKIRQASDLAGIGTLGFRGEALPSIASVSRFTLTTCLAKSESGIGVQVVVDGGKIMEVKEAGRSPGTTVEVRQLFHNVPARRKFLRSQETERAHIQHYLTLVALAWPEVAWGFRLDKRQIWQLPAMPKAETTEGRLEALKKRWGELPGGEERLLPVDFTGKLAGFKDRERDTEYPTLPVRVWGLIGAPGVGRSTRQDQHLFVNRRPVDNRGLNGALQEGYHTALPKGRYPVCALFLEMAPSEFDVNIHPAKREVKFHREQAVRRLLVQAVRHALSERSRPMDMSAETPASSETEPSWTSAPPGEDSPSSWEAPSKPESVPSPEPIPRPPEQTEWLSSKREKKSTPTAEKDEWKAVPPRDPGKEHAEKEDRSVEATSHPPGDQGASSPEANGETVRQDEGISNPTQGAPREEVAAEMGGVPLRFLGTAGNAYFVMESDRGLVLVDQRAAHERVLFERILRQHEADAAPSQRLLLPQTVELAPRDAQFLRDQLDVLNRMGVGLSEFGESTFLLDALPPFVEGQGAREFVLELIDELRAAGKEVNTWRLGEEAIARTVCHKAVNGRDVLSETERQKLIDDLQRCAMPYTSPSGRPTLVEISYNELERKFSRPV